MDDSDAQAGQAIMRPSSDATDADEEGSVDVMVAEDTKRTAKKRGEKLTNRWSEEDLALITIPTRSVSFDGCDLASVFVVVALRTFELEAEVKELRLLQDGAEIKHIHVVRDDLELERETQVDDRHANLSKVKLQPDFGCQTRVRLEVERKGQRPVTSWEEATFVCTKVDEPSARRFSCHVISNAKSATAVPLLLLSLGRVRETV
eukprot:1308791-Rhodomonas_salina.2